MGVANETGGISTSIEDTQTDDEESHQWAASVDSLTSGSDISHFAGGCSQSQQQKANVTVMDCLCRKQNKVAGFVQGLILIHATIQTSLRCKQVEQKAAAGGPDLGEVSVLCGLDGILGDVVPEDEAWVGAVHHPHPLILHGPHVALALQLQGQTLPVGSDKAKRTVSRLQAAPTPHFLYLPLHRLSLSLSHFLHYSL